MKTRLVLLVLGVAASLSNTGCVAFVAAQLKNKLPPVQAEELTVSVNIAAIGGGSIATKGLTNKDGVAKAAEFSEEINTPSGSLKITGKNVEIGQIKK
jgi:hypothetical protein